MPHTPATPRTHLHAALARLAPRRSDYAEARRSWRADLVAGVTVGVVALPLALAFGVSSGAGAAAGLVTAVVAGLVAAVFGGSNVQVSGPTGAMAVVLAPIVAAHGVGAVAVVSVLAGAIVLAAGVLGLGRVVTLIPWPVIEGFTLGIAAVIFLQQVPFAVAKAPDITLHAPRAALEAAAGADWSVARWSLAVVGLVAVVMVALPRLHKGIPASLVAVVAATVLTEALDLPLPRIGALPDTLPVPSLPALDPATVSTLLGAALAVAALAAIESLLSARVAAGMSDTGPYDPDRELAGQGLASVASGLFGGIPATGAIARTAVNVRSGARTRVSAVTHSVVLLGVVYLATGPVGRIPLAALAGVLMVTCLRMVSRATLTSVFRSSRAEAAVFTVTAVVTVAYDLVDAVEIGVLVAAFFALRALAKASGVRREELPGARQPGDERIALFRIDGAMFFGAAERVVEQIRGVRRGDPAIEVVVLRMSQIRVMDATGAVALAEMIEELAKVGVTVLVKGVLPQHRTLVAHVGVLDALREEHHLFDDLDAAVAYARDQVRRNVARRSR